MKAVIGGCAFLALIFLLLAPTVSAQERAEGWVELEYLEHRTSLGPNDEAIVPLKVRAEIQCVALQDPPKGSVRMSGRSGIGHYTGDGYYYTTEAKPEKLPFQHAGSDRYVVDETIEFMVRTGLPVEESTDNTVRYSTVGLSSSEGCSLNGWSLPSAEPAHFVVQLIPPDPNDTGLAKEGSGASSLVFITAVIGSISVLFGRVAASRRG